MNLGDSRVHGIEGYEIMFVFEIMPRQTSAPTTQCREVLDV
ncbi:hypothetical protein BCF46_2827 [Litoreibacter meonggei]|uniref:Uncharacterized protein n=1 Tax=Litoreibacter meonggei TaxID=1049199 RepID=A0A497VHY7_9RHOB|nr:hypothetical protein BCF46_2827 [Litoreibacter meonggei]